MIRSSTAFAISTFVETTKAEPSSPNGTMPRGCDGAQCRRVAGRRRRAPHRCRDVLACGAMDQAVRQSISNIRQDEIAVVPLQAVGRWALISGHAPDECAVLVNYCPWRGQRLEPLAPVGWLRGRRMVLLAALISRPATRRPAR